MNCARASGTSTLRWEPVGLPATTPSVMSPEPSDMSLSLCRLAIGATVAGFSLMSHGPSDIIRSG
jgi:hypothetical protein